MAAGTIGQLTEFDPEVDSVSAYVERVQFFLEANEVKREKYVAVLLSTIGAKTHAVLRNLFAPESLREKSFGELVAALKRHYEPKPLVIAERFKFHRRVQAPGESVSTFVAELRRLTIHCEFRAHLDEALRDRLVCGLSSEATQKRLLTEPDLTFAKAVEIATSMEEAAKNARTLQSSGTTARDVNKVGQGPRDISDRCYRCGKPGHRAVHCPMKSERCHSCGKIGHTRAVCRSSGQAPKSAGRADRGSRKSSKRQVQTVLADLEEPEDVATLHQIRSQAGQPLEVKVTLGGKPQWMELDTGAAVSLISRKTFQDLLPEETLQATHTQLRTYSGEPIPVVGQLEVDVGYEGQLAKLPLMVVEGEGPSLFGRDWLAKIRLDWKSINAVGSHTLDSILGSHQELFRPGLGTLKGYKAKIIVEVGAQPRFCKARTVPYALRGKVEEELTRLEKEGIIEPVQFADWAAPIVPVLKGDGKSLRICGDFKLTINQASKLDRYPIPRIEDLFAKLTGGTSFSKLDMSQAYQQVILDEDSRQYAVINTHKGLYRYNRLPFGIASAPGCFQRVMEGLLGGIPGVVVYLDDILITGRTKTEHLATLDTVLQKLRDAGLRLRKDKCVFMTSSVEYLGHQIDAQGLHPIKDKVKALQEVPKPRNVSELNSYLGLLTYYSRFLPNLSTALAPLHKLLHRNEHWKWTPAQDQAFERSKKMLLESQLLVHFDPSLEIRLACDASSYGIGAVLSHQMPDGSEKPVGFVSRTLTDAEKKYSQIEKEALACVYGVKRFHSYLYGHHFVLQTDHKPLVTLFNENREVPPQAANRIQRWALTLASYEYAIACRGTRQHANANAMSRLPLLDKPAQTPVPAELVLLVEKLADAPISATQISKWTRQDPLLSTVLHYIQQGWPERADGDEIKPYWSRRFELTVHQGCIIWCGRVVVPPPGQESVLLELHGGHPGTSRMKSLARSLVWWPGLDKEIEQLVQSCPECQQERPSPPSAPLHPWSWPTRPWARLHIDFAGPMEGKSFLIVIDAHSKWMEVIPMTTATAELTVQHLRQLFARFGIPESIVSDNGPQFTSEEFSQFCYLNGVKHIRVAPYHPSSNGLAERAVQVFKQGFRKTSTGTVSDRLARFLFQYRITPHTTTGVSPAEMLFGRRLRSRLDLLKPSVHQRVEERQRQQQRYRDQHSRTVTFTVGEKVFIKNFRPGRKWLPGHIHHQRGPVSFEIELEDGRTCHRHQDHIRKRRTDSEDKPTVQSSEETDEILLPTTRSETNTTAASTELSVDESTEQQQQTTGTTTATTTVAESGLGRHYPARVRRPPDRLTY